MQDLAVARVKEADAALSRVNPALPERPVRPGAPIPSALTQAADARARAAGAADAIQVATIAQQLQREQDLLDAQEDVPDSAMREAGALLLKRREFAKSTDEILAALAGRQDIPLVLPRPDAPQIQADIKAIRGDDAKRAELNALINKARVAALSEDEDEQVAAIAQYAWLSELARLAGPPSAR